MTGPEYLRVDLGIAAQISLEAALVHALIEFRSRVVEGGQWETTVEEMARQLPLSEYAVRKASTALQDAGLAGSERPNPFKSQRVYWAVSPGQVEDAKLASSELSSLEGSVTAKLATTNLRVSTVHEDASFDSSSCKEGKKETPLTPEGNEGDADGLFAAPETASRATDPTAASLRSVPTEADLDAEFQKFWDLYPKKKGRAPARVAYGQARRGTRAGRGKPAYGPVTPNEVAAGLHRARAEWAAQGTPVQYIPGAQRWLNERAWEDEGDAPAVGSAAVQTPYAGPPREAILQPPPMDYSTPWVKPTFVSGR